MKKISMQIPAFFIGVIFLTSPFTGSAQHEPNVFTADIDHFWIAFDSVQTIKEKNRQIEVMQSLYIDKATAGLKLYMQLRKFDAEKLVETINKYPRFWQSVRNNTLTVLPNVPAIETNITRFRKLYPYMRPAKIYFLISAIKAAGVTQDSMILIASEISMGNRYTDVSELPDKRLENFFKPKTTNNIVPIAIHEYVHAQQKTEGKTLLGQCIYEGACDCITELVLNRPLNQSYLIYGRAHEKELKEQFKKEMFGEDYSNWLYNGNTAKNMGDLGYFMGYAICKSYYYHARNKQLAIQQIIGLNYADLPAVKTFLVASAYYKE